MVSILTVCTQCRRLSPLSNSSEENWFTPTDFNHRYKVDLSSLQSTHGLCHPCYTKASSLPPSPSPPMSPSSSTPRVLVVDDNHFQRSLLQLMIQRAGYECDCASNGTEALKMVERTYYPLVLMDCILDGGMDGWYTTSKMRELHPDRKTMIVAVTGLDKTKELFDRCQAAGMEDVASKPLHKDTLQAWLTIMQSRMLN